MEQKPWIGVDLDGTLAHHTRHKGLSFIGKPIDRMARRVRRWHNAGKRVKIFTARAHDPKAASYIKKWLKDNGLPDLEITNVKDPGMIRMWDDRAVPMVKNKGVTHQDGRIAESVVDILLDAEDDGLEEIGRMGGVAFSRDPTRAAYWLDPSGNLIRVPHHITWARQVVLKDTPLASQGADGVYPEMRRRGWVRVTEKRDTVWVNPQYCSPRQMSALKDFCIENDFVLVDEASRGEPEIFNPRKP